MTAIGKGDFVEWIGLPADYVLAGGLLIWNPPVGSIHIVDEVGRRCGDAAGRAWDSIRVRGMPLYSRRGRPFSAPLAGFRPISGGKPGMFNELLKAPTDAPREPVVA